MQSFFYPTVKTVEGNLSDVVRAAGGRGGDAQTFDDHHFAPPIELPNNNDFTVDNRPTASFHELTGAKAFPSAPRPIKPTPQLLPLVSSSYDIGAKRRRGQEKKVICVPAPTADQESSKGSVVVPSDLWSWRKYGQKPIKGSPYPRGYYRCSTSKGCLARKQVERSPGNPTMLVITYTAEHDHPWPTQKNLLAGSSRSKQPKNYSIPESSTRISPVTPNHLETKDDDMVEMIKEDKCHEFELESFDFYGELGGLELLDPSNLFDWDGN